MPQLDTSTFASQIFWLVVAFALLFIVVRTLAAPRLTRIADERARRTQGDLAAAEGARVRSAERASAHQARIAAAHDEGRAALAAETDRARDAGGAALADLGGRLNARIEAAETRVADASARAQSELDTAAAQLAAELVERLTGRAPDAGRVAQAVAETRA
jgi:F-type H+-transporting ATPase subunit b